MREEIVESKPHKIVLLGDSKCGKSSLLRRHTRRTFSEDYVPTVFDSGSAEIVSDQNNDIKLNIWDTSGSSEFDHIRPLSFTEVGAFVICFDIDKPLSLENVQKKWLPEVRSCNGDKPVILVGCKLDLKVETKITHGKYSIACPQGMLVAKSIGAHAYIECSCKTDENNVKVDKIFRVAALLATGQASKIPKDVRIREAKGKPNPKCSIM